MMGKKPLASINLKLADINILNYFFKENRDGFYQYVDPASGLHLTCLGKNGIMSAHITDESECEGGKDRKIWEMSISDDDMAKGIEKSLRRAFRKYRWNETVYIINDELYKMISGIGESGTNKTDIDLLHYFKTIIDLAKRDQLITKMKARDAWEKGIKFGIQTSKTQQYIVILIDDKYCVKFNINPKKNFNKFNPFYMGMIEYEKRIFQKGRIDWVSPMSDPQVALKIKEIADDMDREPELNVGPKELVG
jgi:hypothetical protein